jgi:NADH pyrophosphatase NudC (nudix superfamily)
MDLASILLVLTVLILTGAFILRPFFEKRTRIDSAPEFIEGAEQAKLEHTRSSLLAEKERVLNSLQELDFDNSLHKIPEDLYPEQRSALMKQAAGILKQLEEMGFPQESTPAQPENKPVEVHEGYDELEELISRRRGEMKEKSSGFCPRCGKAIKESDRFCPKCGATIHAV